MEEQRDYIPNAQVEFRPLISRRKRPKDPDRVRGIEDNQKTVPNEQKDRGQAEGEGRNASFVAPLRRRELDATDSRRRMIEWRCVWRSVLTKHCSLN